MNINNKILFCALAIASISGSLPAYAKLDSVSYRCPTIEEAGEIGPIRTSIHNKTAHWEVKNNLSIRGDKASEFKKAVLRYDNKSYDMTVRCIYKTKENQKMILGPLASFNWYVDAVAEKALGSSWHKMPNGNLECTKSILNCGFIFR